MPSSNSVMKIETIFDVNESADGMVDIFAVKDVIVRGMDVHVGSNGTEFVELWNKNGSYKHHKRHPGALIFVASQNLNAEGFGKGTPLSENIFDKSKYIRFRLVNYRTVPDYLRIINNPSSVKFIQFRKLSTTFYESRELRNKHNGLHYYIFVSSMHYLLRIYPIYYCSETYIEGMLDLLSLVGSSLSRYMSVAKILD